jgi:hypothetical protein
MTTAATSNKALVLEAFDLLFNRRDYEHSTLGILDRDRGQAELPVLGAEREELIEHGDARPDSSGVSLTPGLQILDDGAPA